MTIRTTCPYCGVGCGIAVKDGIPRGDEAHPANFGRLCSKGAALKQTLTVPDRLTAPVLHGRDAGWDETLDFIAAEFLRIRERHGPDAIAFYVSGQFLTEDYYVANKLMKGFIGSGNIDTNSRLCMASSVAGHVRAFGEDVVPGCYDDLEQADLAVVVGSNMAWCHPVLYQRLMAAREARGTKVVVIDPRRTSTAETADLHLPLAPGTDLVLLNGLIVHLADTGALDCTRIAAHVDGCEEALAAARLFAPSIAAVAAATGLTTDTVWCFYDLFARTERAVTLYSQGINQSIVGTDNVNAIINCHLATGRIGRPGMGPFSLTGQPNAMGGREVGGLATQLAAHMSFTPAHIDRVRRFWGAPAMATRPGLKAVDLFDAVADGRVQAIWIAATNPADTMPRADHVRAALRDSPLVIVSDAWPTDTTELAHVVLPAASWAEKEGTVTNSERCISRQRAFRHAPGEAKPDWWMFAQLGRRMGWEKPFAYSGPADIFREHAALSGFENEGERVFDMSGLAGIDDDAYENLQPFQWPRPQRGCAVAGRRLFGDGIFPTDNGRGRMVALAVTPKEEQGKPSFTLNTGRVRDQWHTMTRTGRVAELMAHSPEPHLVLHPGDASRLGITKGGLTRLETRDGSAVLRAVVDAGLRPGDVFLPMHWTDQFTSAGPIGRLVHALTDPISGQPDLKRTQARLAPLAECWRGLLLRQSDGPLDLGSHAYWSKAPSMAGFAYRLSGWSALADIVHSGQVLRNLLRIPPEAELVSYSDPKRAVFRYAGLVAGRLEACIFFAPPGAAFPEGDGAVKLLGRPIEPVARLALLAGVLPGAPARNGKIVCACFAVGEAAIRDAIDVRRLASPAEIGAALGAGTNCGSCIPEIRKLLAAPASRVSSVP